MPEHLVCSLRNLNYLRINMYNDVFSDIDSDSCSLNSSEFCSYSLTFGLAKFICHIIWANYNNSRTWIKAIKGDDFPYINQFIFTVRENRVRSWSNLPRYNEASGRFLTFFQRLFDINVLRQKTAIPRKGKGGEHVTVAAPMATWFWPGLAWLLITLGTGRTCNGPHILWCLLEFQTSVSTEICFFLRTLR